jgi:prepilin-type N-terminal cleavage/methylation domain-containing protein
MFQGSNQRGFTLIELMVVVGIISVLSVVVLTSLSASKSKSRDQERVAEISQIQLALAYYYDIYFSYPPTLSDDRFTPLVVSLPKDPSTGADYAYASIGASCGTYPPSSYHLGATLELASAALSDDSNFNSSVGTNVCGGAGFDGTSPLIYDVRP